MKVVGLITEYNPFHNGHKYHIDEAKRMTGADYVVAVMSGDFVQRGAPAVMDKYCRAEMALRNGVDVVLELPVCYATGSAEFFALGAVSLLDKLGIVDHLCFGSECGDIGLLKEAAEFLIDTPAPFDSRLQAFLKDGLTYPAARQKALQHSMDAIDSANSQELARILTEPNNILGIEYMKALLRLHSSMIPVTIQRISSGYHDTKLAGKYCDSDISMAGDNSFQAEHSDTKDSLPAADAAGYSNAVISSATAIRKAILNEHIDCSDYLKNIEHSVPDNVFQILKNNYHKNYPVFEEDFTSIIRYKLLAETRQTLAEYADITGDLADRMSNISDLNCSFTELTSRIKTRNMTMTRINRALFHLLLNIHTEAFKEYNLNGYTRYARVLGIKKGSTQLLKAIEKRSGIPVITRLSRADKQLDVLGKRMLSGDIFAAHLYNQTIYEKYGTALANEYRHGVCIL